MQLLYLKYNNYNNRIIKRESTLEDYAKYALGNPMFADWNPNDGVTTTITVNENWTTGEAPDYLVCYENNEIVSRWFVTEYARLRGGQFKATFRRDVIADYYDKTISAPAFIEKATLEDNDPYIFNIEKDVGFNQIKKSETLLKDETGCPWIVGYVPRNAFQEDTEIIGDVATTQRADIVVNGIRNWEFYNYTNLAPNQQTASFVDNSSVVFNVYTTDVETQSRRFKFSFNENGGVTTGWTHKTNGVEYGDFVPGASSRVLDSDVANPYYPDEITRDGLFKQNTASTAQTNLDTIMGAFSSSDFATMKSYIGTEFNNITQEQAIRLQQLNGKVIKDNYTNLYYTITTTLSYGENSIYQMKEGSLYNLMKSRIEPLITSGFFITDSEVNLTSFRFSATGGSGTITLQQFSTEGIKTTIKKNRYHLIDAPYDMFCMPYSSEVILKQGSNQFRTTPDISLNIGVNIGLQTGADNIYDLQLLPYCPIRNFIITKAEDGTPIIDFSDYPSYSLITSGTSNAGALFWASVSNFETTIDYQINITNPKIENQTDLYRICSPNYSNAFDFNAAMNGGLDYFIVECTYKPFTPYIHVYPNFKLMYGSSGFKDARGLICGGEYSLPQMTSAWADYELNNKASLSIFDKTISRLTGQDPSKVMSNTLYSLSPDGSNQKAIEYAAQYDYYKYGYDIGNIMAMPTGISKTSALTYNNKLFPFVEYYTCTDEEKTAFSLKLKYDGMTVMRISDVGISEFIKQNTRTYIKAKVIKLEDLGDDAHMAKTIESELRKGIYIGG